LSVLATADCELEVWAAHKQIAALEQTLRRPVKIVAHHLEELDEPARPRPRRHPLPHGTHARAS
jgi:hypothetical protein